MTTRGREPHPDPIVEAQIQRSLERYKGAPASMLATMREILEDTLTTDPRFVAMLAELRRAAATQASGEGRRVGEGQPSSEISGEGGPTRPNVERSGETRREDAGDPGDEGEAGGGEEGR